MHTILELFQAVGLGLVLLLPLTNPPTTVALLLGLSGNMSDDERNRQARMASIYVFAIMTGAFYGGQLVMNTFGISLPGLRIAGGLIVAFIGFRMLFPHRTADQAPEVTAKSDELQKRESANIAFVPLAMPSTAGPGTIAMIISSASSLKTQTAFSPLIIQIAPVATFLTLSIIIWGCMRCAGGLMRLIGKSGIEAISRIMGFLLVCMGVQFVINGVLEIVASMPH